ncbi:hypothetical protein HCN44_007119 [Aphidius gifuensis]|uniref:Gustatory receptor n=1 Tax=Aphidius gifuensis TaxID=684658 RepID=A0A834XP16_APHGI|nr:uncharacterized protein LOC122857423 [Aphidius gifuensis]KAF7988809.1 hypothetical protein HCN44_007119 [Aphidius gifuensis]
MEDSIAREFEIKYLKEEKLLIEKLKKCEEQRANMRSENKLNYKNYNNSKFVISKEAAIIRNEKLLKDLEISRARLRTLTSFSPTDRELYDRIITYRTCMIHNDP